MLFLRKEQIEQPFRTNLCVEGVDRLHGVHADAGRRDLGHLANRGYGGDDMGNLKAREGGGSGPTPSLSGPRTSGRLT